MHITITDKEKQILYYLCTQLSSKQIAPLVKLSVKTVNTYRRRLLKITGSVNTAGLVLYAIREGIYVDK